MSFSTNSFSISILDAEWCLWWVLGILMDLLSVVMLSVRMVNVVAPTFLVLVIFD